MPADRLGTWLRSNSTGPRPPATCAAVNSSWPGCVIRVLPDEGRTFNLVDRGLSWIRVDYQAWPQFWDAELVIETSFELRVDEQAYTLDPSHRTEPLVSVHHANASSKFA